MLEIFEEINLDIILERAGLFKNEFETNEYDAILYDNDIKKLLNNLFLYDKDIINNIKDIIELDKDNNYLSIHRKLIETILKTKNKVNDEEFKKTIKNNKIDYKVKRLLRQSDLSYVLNKYLKNEPITEELLYLSSLDYYLDFIIDLIVNNYEDEIPYELKSIISQRLEEINKYIPKE